MPTHGKRMMIHVDAPRLRCKPCNKTFTAVIAEIDEKRLVTSRLVTWIGGQALNYTFAAVAEQVGVDEKTIIDMLENRYKTTIIEFRRSMKVELSPKANLGLKHDRKLLTMRNRDLSEQQFLLVSGWLNSFPQLKAAYELKEHYIDIWSKSTKEEALAEYLRWEASITPELMKAFKPITVA
jgi:hypothetical protein